MTRPKPTPAPAAPQLPEEFTEHDSSVPIEAEATISEARVTGLVTGSAINTRWEACFLDRAKLAAAVWTGAHWEDLRLEGCDLANLQGSRLYAIRVAVTDSRLLGMQAIESDWKDAVFTQCGGSMANFSGSKFARVRFENCDFSEADFTDCDLRTAVFRNCRLERADFTGAKLNGADWRGCELEGVRLSVRDMKGLAVTASQAAYFARLLGLKVLGEPDEQSAGGSP